MTELVKPVIKESNIELADTALSIGDPPMLKKYLMMGLNYAADARICWADWLAQDPDANRETFQKAKQLDIPLLKRNCFRPDASVHGLLSSTDVRRLRAIPLLAIQGRVAVAMVNPDSERVMNTLNFLLNERVMPVLVSAREMRAAIAEYFDHEEDLLVSRQLGLDPSTQATHSELDIEKLAREKPIVRIVTDLITEAVARRASDIHLRPGQNGLEALYRIDDELVPVRQFMRLLQPAIVSRVKVLASINIADRRRPQDGRTSFILEDGRKIDLRVSVLPAVFGESVVVRLLDTNESLWSLEQLGLSDEDRVRVDDIMERSHGMFLTTGPTGCGKSTTLYAMLLEMRKQRINILTIEDPVEFYIDEIQQMQVNRAAGFTFASAMRNFLRHDPDVIMVGEIRDRETAGIAVESALTGHLLLSTLHTNTAATTVTRLLDLGVEAYLLRVSLVAVMSQRLVRLICEHCRGVETVHQHIREFFAVADSEVFYVGAGCAHCEGLGVHKRRAVYELMIITPCLQALIVPGAQADEINRVAIAQGMVPITQAALKLARAGVISLSEAWRVRAD